MKYYIKFMTIAIVLGIMISIMLGTDEGTTTTNLIKLWSGANRFLLFAEIGNFMTTYFPILFFHIFFGTYIYRHYCSGSIYYFSRCTKIGQWYLKEALQLYLYIALYLITLITSSLCFSVFVFGVKWDTSTVILLIYYLLIYSLFLFFTTMCINVVSILISNSNGFIFVESVILLFIATFFFLGETAFSKGEIYQQQMYILYCNPISYLIFSVHSSHISELNDSINLYHINFDINYSVLLYFILSIVVVAVGFVIVKKHVFLSENTEGGF